MPFVNVPKDLANVKTKVALNLTKRQIACFGGAACVGVHVFLLARSPLGNQSSVLVMIAVMLPFFFAAMYEKDGQPAEKIAANFLRAHIWPARRVYRTINLYECLEKEGKAIGQRSHSASRDGGDDSSRGDHSTITGSGSSHSPIASDDGDS